MDEEQQKRQRIQAFASYVTLPFVLGIPPIVGWYIGSWLDDYFEISPYGKYSLLVLGFVGGIREVYRIVSKYKDEQI